MRVVKGFETPRAVSGLSHCFHTITTVVVSHRGRQEEAFNSVAVYGGHILLILSGQATEP